MSIAVVAKARYLASALESETISCFFDAYAMQLELRNMQNPIVLLLVTVQPAQSASQNVLTVSNETNITRASKTTKKGVNGLLIQLLPNFLN